MINKKLLLCLFIATLLVLQILTGCTKTVRLCDGNNVTQFALQSLLAGEITKKQALKIAQQFFNDIYSHTRFTDKKIEVNGVGFSVVYAQQANGSGKHYVFMKSTWQNLSSIIAENKNVFNGRRNTFEEFRVQFEGTKSIQTDPANIQPDAIKERTVILFEKGISRLSYSRRDTALAMLILSGRLSVAGAHESAQLANKKRGESKDKKTYKIVFILLLIGLLFFVLKFKNIAATRSNRYCSTCKKAFDKDLDNCPTCGKRATEIITPDGWTWHIRNDTLPGVAYAYILAAIIIFAILVFVFLLVTGI